MTKARDEIGRIFHEINREIRERMRQSFRGCELPFGALHLLREIQREPGVTVNEVARRTGLAKSHVSKMLEQMVRQGYVSKESDPSDQRLLRIYLTPAGRETVENLERRAHTVWAGVIQAIPESQVDDVLRGIRAMHAALAGSNTVTTHAHDSDSEPAPTTHTLAQD
jgi:DNA-binding MarR family transcriptional regulator